MNQLQSIPTDEINAQILELETQMQRLQQSHQVLKNEQSRRAIEFIQKRNEQQKEQIESLANK